MQNLKTPARWLILFFIAALSAGCGRSGPDYQKLLHENEQLKAELEANKKEAGEKTGKASGTAADLELDINNLWTQRFDDNEFRSRQRLTDKIIRVTGTVEGVTESSVTLLGDSKRFGNVRMTVNFNPSYAARSRAGFASLERGLEMTVQGKFVFERTSLSDATFVDRKTGKQLSSDEIAALARDRLVEPSPRP